MVVRRAAAFAVCLAMSVTTAPSTSADPDVAPAGATTPANGQVPSADPAVVNTPVGWRLALGAKDEALFPVHPLTTAISSREYVASGIFVASLVGPEAPQGEFEVGYEIGCGIDMSTSNGVELGGSAGVQPGIGYTGPLVGIPTSFLPVVTVPVAGQLTVGLKPGLIIVVPVVKKQFKAPDPWVMISNFHVKIDGCVGESFIRSYATLTRITDQSDVVVSYIGVTKAV
ncbi:MAG: MspA family porin [Mycobacterium sp.]